MKKIYLLGQVKYQEESLKLLRKIGVVHLERKAVSSDALALLLDDRTKAESVLRILKAYEKENIDSKTEVKNDSSDTSPDIIKQVMEYSDERKILSEELARLKKEQNRILEWGNFDPYDFTYLAEKNIRFFLYKLTRKAKEKLSEDTRYILLEEDKNFLRLLVLDNEIPGRAPFALGEHSISELDSLISAVLEKIARIDGELSTLAESAYLVEKHIGKLLIDIEFETARAKMSLVEDIPDDSAVSWISGFVPQEDLGLVKRGASENGWALLAEDPGPDDFVPTKLKNNRFVNLLSPVTSFLNINPGYDEADISGWFLLFFTIFFGMIFGDAFYGALLLIIAIIGILKTMKKGVHVGLKLLLLLGCSNFIWGVLTCSWFGLEVHQIPLFLQRLSLPLISNVTAAQSDYHDGIVRQHMMIICFSLALVHLCIGHLVAISRTRSLKILADLGGIAMLIGMYGVVLSLIASNEYRQIPLLMPFVYLLGIGFVFVFVFSGYQGKIGASVMDGFKNIISMILGIANVFSDIMSYIRLWAVGLAGAAIASTVMAMAGPMLGNIVFLAFGIFIMVFGHGLNLVLNTLSVLVHAVRLNTLEFSGHVGLTWSGTAYKPFKENT